MSNEGANEDIGNHVKSSRSRRNTVRYSPYEKVDSQSSAPSSQLSPNPSSSDEGANLGNQGKSSRARKLTVWYSPNETLFTRSKIVAKKLVDHKILYRGVAAALKGLVENLELLPTELDAFKKLTFVDSIRLVQLVAGTSINFSDECKLDDIIYNSYLETFSIKRIQMAAKCMLACIQQKVEGYSSLNSLQREFLPALVNLFGWDSCFRFIHYGNKPVSCFSVLMSYISDTDEYGSPSSRFENIKKTLGRPQALVNICKKDTFRIADKVAHLINL